MAEKVFIVILNRNGRIDTIECLESVFNCEYLNYDVVLVDNASTDGSIEKIKLRAQGSIPVQSKYFKETSCTHKINVYKFESSELFGSGLEITTSGENTNKNLYIVSNNENYGFAKGNNVVMSHIAQKKPDSYICLLNNDTVVDKCFLDNMLLKLVNKSDVGMVAPVNYNYYTGEIDFYGGYVSKYNCKTIHNIKKNNNEEFEFLTGCCLLFKASTIESVRFFSEEYFCYYEDADLCQKVLSKNLKLVLAQNSKIYHKISGSTGKKSPFVIKYMTRNQIIFSLKFNIGLFRYYVLLYSIINILYTFLNFDFYVLKRKIIGFYSAIQLTSLSLFKQRS